MKKPVIKKIKSDSGLSASDLNTNDTRPTLSGTAVANAFVTIFDNGKVIGRVKANAAGQWTFTTKKLKDGVHKFVAEADLGGQSAKSAAVKLTVDSTAPASPAFVLDAASDSGASANDQVSNDATPTLTGTAEPGATIIVRDGPAMLGTTVADALGNWSFTAPALGDGIHSITATATDLAGNVGSASTALNVTIDTAAPAPPSTPNLDAGSDSGPSATDDVTNDATAALTGTAEPGAIITIKDGATVLGTVIADASGSWSFTTGPLSDGVHGLSATATDAAGNASVASAALNLTIDTAAPAAPSTPISPPARTAALQRPTTSPTTPRRPSAARRRRAAR